MKNFSYSIIIAGTLIDISTAVKHFTNFLKRNFSKDYEYQQAFFIEGDKVF